MASPTMARKNANAKRLRRGMAARNLAAIQLRNQIEVMKAGEDI